MLCFTIQQSMLMPTYQRPTERLLYCWATCSKACLRRITRFFPKAWELEKEISVTQLINKLFITFSRAKTYRKKSKIKWMHRTKSPDLLLNLNPNRKIMIQCRLLNIILHQKSRRARLQRPKEVVKFNQITVLSSMLPMIDILHRSMITNLSFKI